MQITCYIIWSKYISHVKCSISRASRQMKPWNLHLELLKCFPVNHFGRKSFQNISHPSNLVFREGNGTPLQYSCLENPMGGGAWWATVHGVAKGRTRLSDFTFTFHFHALEKEMTTHSSVLALRIPGMGESGGLPSMGLHRVGHD